MHHRPKCIIVTGRPGSGKTTLSKILGQQLWMPVISRDEIKEGYVNTFGLRHDQLPPDTNGVVTRFFFEIVTQYLKGKVSVVVEAAFDHQAWEPRMSGIAEVGFPIVVVCAVDEMIAANRHLQRGLDNPGREFFHGDRRVSVYRETGVLSPPGNFAVPELNVPTIHFSTAGEYRSSVGDIVKQIQSSNAQ